MSEYYNRDGSEMTREEWLTSYESNRGKKRVAETTLPDGKWVSTVWLGLNHSYGDGPPMIFETMVFENKQNLSEEDCEQYSTEAEALEGHQRMVEKWSKVRTSDSFNEQAT